VNLFITVLETADLSVIAADDVNLPSLHRIITSAPNSLVEAASPEWQEDSDCYGLIQVAEAKAEKLGRKNDFELTKNYWLKEFPNLAVETRTATVSMFTSLADGFLRGMLRELFCTDLNFSPEDCFDGKIILIDLPVKEYHELGQFAQGLFKYVWQRAVERRVPAGTKREEAQEKIRPVFLWADESQFFVDQYDAMFQSTARSSRACTVYLTQNLPGYHTAFGNSRGAAEAFLGNLQTKIFHANGDLDTNNWASNSIGRIRQIQTQGGLSDGA
jgi:TraM recognition site of TraD and TraG